MTSKTERFVPTKAIHKSPEALPSQAEGLSEYHDCVSSNSLFEAVPEQYFEPTRELQDSRLHDVIHSLIEQTVEITEKPDFN